MSNVIIDHHPRFNKEIKKFIKKHCSSNTDLNQTLSGAVKLIKKQIYQNETFLSCSCFGQASGFSAYAVYWYKLMIANSGLRKNQHPKCYLYADEKHISFLCCSSHLSNYQDSQLKSVARGRLKEMFEKWKKCI